VTCFVCLRCVLFLYTLTPRTQDTIVPFPLTPGPQDVSCDRFSHFFFERSECIRLTSLQTTNYVRFSSLSLLFFAPYSELLTSRLSLIDLVDSVLFLSSPQVAGHQKVNFLYLFSICFCSSYVFSFSSHHKDVFFVPQSLPISHRYLHSALPESW